MNALSAYQLHIPSAHMSICPQGHLDRAEINALKLGTKSRNRRAVSTSIIVHGQPLPVRWIA